ncbi:MAG: hypothetical protein GOVbin1807_128 [Prokaryotic dsDNA virus sp.]|nr:MAG: hypothetical protein GOVbin1807_128 [Prokaryotic dsDNA virus sp.]|tara:strand:- start:18 stop:959 length:942 start_codon:yes stop_codon:yes gene_type:complete
MGFQDNSGDIIFDVVLTDEGRRRLAAGNFSITQFALGDDEINYELYNTNASSYDADLEILQTPVLEAFTNNQSSMKSKLVTYPRNDLLHLTVLKLNELSPSTQMHSNGAFMIAVDGTTEDNNGAKTATTAVAVSSTGVNSGFMFGQTPAGALNHIRVDSGLDTTALAPNQLGKYPDSLRETQYEIVMDTRLGELLSVDNKMRPKGVTDDDGFTTYRLSLGRGSSFIKENQITSNNTATQVIKGPRGTYLEFKVASSLSLQQNTYLFNLLGSEGTMTNASSASQNIKFIDSIIKVTGLNTGYSINIPVRYVKVV